MNRNRELAVTVSAANPCPSDALAAFPMPLGRELVGLLPSTIKESEAATPRPTRRTKRLVLAVASLCVVVLCAVSFTPPGRAIAGWVGDQLGVGHPGGPPSAIVQRFRQFTTIETSASGQPAHVLAAGLAPRDMRYEFITYWPHPPKGSHRGSWEMEMPCFELDLVGREQLTAPNGRTYRERSSYGQGCGILPTSPLWVQGVGGNLEWGKENLYFSGRAAPEVRTIEARINGRAVDLRVVRIPPRFARRFRLGKSFSFFIGFIDLRHGGILTVKARDAHGQVVATRRSSIVDVEARQESDCLIAREALEKGTSSGRAARHAVRFQCRGVRGR
jgi:hypothetical protein